MKLHDTADGVHGWKLAWEHIVIVSLSLAISSVLALALTPVLHDQAQMLPFTLAVLVASWEGGLAAGLITTVLSFVLADYFFTAPLHSLLSVYPDDYAALLVFVIFGTTVSILNHIRLQANVALQRTNQRLDLAAHELEQANEEVERFAHSVAHDLQAPLRVVRIFTELFLQSNRSRLDQGSARQLDLVSNAAGQMSRLIDAILDFARAGLGAKVESEIDTRAVAEIAVEQILNASDQSEAKISLGPMPVLFANEIQVLRLFQNLIENAVKYHGKDPPVVEISAALHGTEWVFSIRDNGIGIDHAYHSQIFEAFQRLHSSRYAGNGMGLATCKRIVQNYGGRIWVESQPGKGSTFYFTLPKQANHQDSDGSLERKSKREERHALAAEA